MQTHTAIKETVRTEKRKRTVSGHIFLFNLIAVGEAERAEAFTKLGKEEIKARLIELQEQHYGQETGAKAQITILPQPDDMIYVCATMPNVYWRYGARFKKSTWEAL